MVARRVRELLRVRLDDDALAAILSVGAGEWSPKLERSIVDSPLTVPESGLAKVGTILGDGVATTLDGTGEATDGMGVGVGDGTTDGVGVDEGIGEGVGVGVALVIVISTGLGSSLPWLPLLV